MAAAVGGVCDLQAVDRGLYRVGWDKTSMTLVVGSIRHVEMGPGEMDRDVMTEVMGLSCNDGASGTDAGIMDPEVQKSR